MRLWARCSDWFAQGNFWSLEMAASVRDLNSLPIPYHAVRDPAQKRHKARWSHLTLRVALTHPIAPSCQTLYTELLTLL